MKALLRDAGAVVVLVLVAAAGFLAFRAHSPDAHRLVRVEHGVVTVVTRPTTTTSLVPEPPTTGPLRPLPGG